MNTLILAFLFPLVFAAEVTTPGISRANPSAFNKLGIRELPPEKWPPSPREKGEIRIALFGGGGFNVALDQTFAKRLEFHLHRITQRPVHIINAAFQEDTARESLDKLAVVLNTYHPDYVYYLFSPPLAVRLAGIETWIQRDARGAVLATNFYTEKSWLYRAMSTLFGLAPPDDLIFLRLMNLYFGQLHLAQKLAENSRSLSSLMEPYIHVMREFKKTAQEKNARFAVLWPGSAIGAGAWSLNLPKRAIYRCLSFVQPMDQRISVDREETGRQFRQGDIPLITNFEAGAYQQRRRALLPLDQPPPRAMEVETFDRLGDLFATSVLSMGLE